MSAGSCIKNSGLSPDDKMPTRQTRQRALILHCLASGKEGEHITAEELAERLRQNHTPVGRATVYRYLKQLEAEGSVRRYAVGRREGDCYQYLGTTDGCRCHFHLLCERCGSVIHADDRAMRTAMERICSRYGFDVDEGRTVFYGLCSECRRHSAGDDRAPIVK